MATVMTQQLCAARATPRRNGGGRRTLRVKVSSPHLVFAKTKKKNLLPKQENENTSDKRASVNQKATTTAIQPPPPHVHPRTGESIRNAALSQTHTTH
jgi:hypothetical protein